MSSNQASALLLDRSGALLRRAQARGAGAPRRGGPFVSGVLPPGVAEGGLRTPADATVCRVDEGLPIAYQVLEKEVPVFASDGEQVGTVDHVVSAPAEDIFHGIVIRGGGGQRFVSADDVASLHEFGVDLRIDATAAAALPEPHGAAPAWRVHEPGVKPSRWTHLVDRMKGGKQHRHDWSEEN